MRRVPCGDVWLLWRLHVLLGLYNTGLWVRNYMEKLIFLQFSWMEV